MGTIWRQTLMCTDLYFCNDLVYAWETLSSLTFVLVSNPSTLCTSYFLLIYTLYHVKGILTATYVPLYVEARRGCQNPWN